MPVVSSGFLAGCLCVSLSFSVFFCLAMQFFCSLVVCVLVCLAMQFSALWLSVCWSVPFSCFFVCMSLVIILFVCLYSVLGLCFGR